MVHAVFTEVAKSFQIDMPCSVAIGREAAQSGMQAQLLSLCLAEACKLQYLSFSG